MVFTVLWKYRRGTEWCWYVFTNQFEGFLKPWFVPFANVCDVKTHTVASFEMPTQRHALLELESALSHRLWEPGPAGSSTPLGGQKVAHRAQASSPEASAEIWSMNQRQIREAAMCVGQTIGQAGGGWRKKRRKFDSTDVHICKEEPCNSWKEVPTLFCGKHGADWLCSSCLCPVDWAPCSHRRGDAGEQNEDRDVEKVQTTWKEAWREVFHVEIWAKEQPGSEQAQGKP